MKSPQSALFALLARACAANDLLTVTLKQSAPIRDRKVIAWMKTVDDKDFRARVYSRPAPLFTRSQGVEVAGVPK
jgi:hypothetical protein